ncbi:MAG: TonB-dependent receptor plug domain-containing protein [Spirochaetes bacterium]|nr:TonB-dependent receptor plug domain-containing protein [Spirochaetota bacterium]
MSTSESFERSTSPVEVITPATGGTEATSLPQLLSAAAGIHINRQGVNGSPSYASVRGGNYNQLVIYVNGIPFADPLYGQMSLDTLPIGSIKRVEIYKGSTPLRFGMAGMGGVINIVTEDNDQSNGETAKNSIKAGYGSFNTIHSSFKRHATYENFSYLLYIARDSSDADFTYINDNGTPILNDDDDSIDKRLNNDYTSYNTNISGSYTFTPCRLTITNSFLYKENGLPGLNNNSALESRFETFRNTSSANLFFDHVLSSSNQLTINGYYSYRSDRLSDPLNEIGLNAAKQEGIFHTYGASAFQEMLIAELQSTLTLSASYNNDTYTKIVHNLSNSEELFPKQYRDTYNIGIENEFSFFSDHLLVTPNLRYIVTHDDFAIQSDPFTSNSTTDEKFSRSLQWKAGSRLFIIKHNRQRLSLFMNIARTSRRPSFIELFGNDGGVLGNPDLKDETALNREAGAEFYIETKSRFVNNTSISYTYFYTDVNDAILFVQNSQNTMLAHNISRSKIDGHEFSIQTRLLRRLQLGANYTFQSAIDKSSIPYYRNNYLPHRPVHEFFGSARLIFHKISAEYSIEAIGSNYLDRANSDFYFIKSRYYHNLLSEVVLFTGLTITLEARNILDEMSRDKIGYPLPGRAFYSTVEYKF